MLEASAPPLPPPPSVNAFMCTPCSFVSYDGLLFGPIGLPEVGDGTSGMPGEVGLSTGGGGVNRAPKNMGGGGMGKGLN